MIKLWLICYDVKDDKRRTQLAKLLEQHCERVQYSVFECPLDVKKIRASSLYSMVKSSKFTGR